MAAGDAQRVWFPEMLECLRVQWNEYYAEKPTAVSSRVRGSPVVEFQLHAFDFETPLVLRYQLRREVIGGRRTPATRGERRLLLLRFSCAMTLTLAGNAASPLT
jgi:hypothetical protein